MGLRLLSYTHARAGKWGEEGALKRRAERESWKKVEGGRNRAEKLGKSCG